jgi:hypothetical protein
MHLSAMSSLVLLSVFTILAPPGSAFDDKAAPVPEKLARAKRDAARKTYEVIWQNNREGYIPVAEVAYRWSRRWLKAEIELSPKKPDQITAYQAHLERMRELSRITHARYQNRVNTLDEASATDYYLSEAQIWLEQAKKQR